MYRCQLKNERLRLEVCPGAGASITSFTLQQGTRQIPILRPSPNADPLAADSSAMSCFLLAPFSNRLDAARFAFGGRTHQLQANFEGSYAIHGCVREHPWQIQAQSATELILSFDSTQFADIGFPFPFTARVRYALAQNTLSASLEMTNIGQDPMPSGLGFHPYFSRTLLDPKEFVELEMTTAAAYADLCPQGPSTSLAKAQDFSQQRFLPPQGFDTCFAGWDGRAKLYWPSSRITAEIRATPSLGHIILYTPPGEDFFALEPVSHANNGFNLLAAGIPNTGVQVLKSQQAMTAGFDICLC